MRNPLRRRERGLSSRLTASYILVTLAVVVLAEVLALGFQVPLLADGVQARDRLQAQIDATAQDYGRRLSADRITAAPSAGPALGDPTQPARPGRAPSTADGRALIVPAVSGPVPGNGALTAVVAIAADGTVLASSAPSRYPPGRPAADELPVQVGYVLIDGHIKTGTLTTRYGSVLWTVWSPLQDGTTSSTAPYIYVQAPWSAPRFINPLSAWTELNRLDGSGALLLSLPAVLLIVFVPAGLLFGTLASRGLVLRIRRLEQATLAVAEGDYGVALPPSGRDEIGRLEANFGVMTAQLGSALAAERARATGDARAAERARISRELHDAVSQHLFGLRMIAAAMRRADPDNERAGAIERVSEEALRDMQVLLIELGPASPDGAGLAPALERLCAAYRHRLGIAVETDLADVTVPADAEHALLRIAQEACANAVRHGATRHLTVSLRIGVDDRHLVLTIADTGTGFDPDAPHAGSGLAHIRDRAAELDGTVTIDSAPGRGTILGVRLPLHLPLEEPAR